VLRLLPGPNRVTRTLRELGAPVDRLIFEVTETAILDQPDALETLRALRDSGIRLAFDDVGAGYCSLAYLRRFAAPVRGMTPGTRHRAALRVVSAAGAARCLR